MTEHANPPSDGITIRLAGGLGNQLFGYACGTAAAARLDCPLYFDTSSFAHQPAVETPRNFELSWLIEAGYAREATLRPARSRLIRMAERRFPLLAPSQSFVERSFTYDDRIQNVTLGTSLSGYFQSWRYFEEIANDLRERITTSWPRSSWLKRQIEILDEVGPWTAIHIRRGDYTLSRNTRYHGLLNQDFYRLALSELVNRAADSKLAIFSDDPAAAREMLSDGFKNVHLVEPPTGIHPMESIILMSRATAIITANSSFSWWGGWLANPLGTTVITPDPWFTGAGYDERDLCPPHWLRLPTPRSI